MTTSIVVVVSCPENGSLKPDETGPYDQKVMSKLMEMQSEDAERFAGLRGHLDEVAP